MQYYCPSPTVVRSVLLCGLLLGFMSLLFCGNPPTVYAFGMYAVVHLGMELRNIRRVYLAGKGLRIWRKKYAGNVLSVAGSFNFVHGKQRKGYCSFS